MKKKGTSLLPYFSERRVYGLLEKEKTEAIRQSGKGGIRF